MTLNSPQSPEYPQWLTSSRLLLCFFVAACLIFGPLYNAGFVTDFTGWLECDKPVWRAYECFGNRGLYFVPFILLEFLTSLFDLHPLPWFLLWTGIHAINAWLVTDLARRLFGAFQFKHHWIVPVFAGAIFLVHPWQVEVLAWKACVNYLTSCLLTLLTLRFYLRFLREGIRKYYWMAIGTYVLFLFTLEFALLFPAVLALLFWCLKADLTPGQRIKTIALQMIPFAVSMGLWFLANKALFGLWIGHYGAETHTVIQPLLMSSVIVKYLLKTLFFTRLLPFPVQTDLYAFLDRIFIGGAMMGVLVGIILMSVFQLSGISRVNRLRIFLFLSAVIFIVPVTNLYFYYLQYSENDRYTYVTIAFLGMWLLTLLWHWKRWVGKAILGIYLLVCLYATVLHVRVWEKSTIAYWNHINTFPEPQKQKVFLLNVPDNYRGTFMFRNMGGDSSFDEVYRYIAKSDYSGKMYDVFQYNMTDLSNDFIVTKESESKIKVEFAQWGNWWWRNGIGGEKYSTEEYQAWQEGKFYYVVFKKPLDDAQVLYYTPEGWKEVR